MIEKWAKIGIFEKKIYKCLWDGCALFYGERNVKDR
jgi:hypothetical protein